MVRLPSVTIFGGVFVHLKFFSLEYFADLSDYNIGAWHPLCGKTFDYLFNLLNDLGLSVCVAAQEDGPFWTFCAFLQRSLEGTGGSILCRRAKASEVPWIPPYLTLSSSIAPNLLYASW